jgi:tRNA U34 2-thiouridine synthase MnmA/TrmU
VCCTDTTLHSFAGYVRRKALSVVSRVSLCHVKIREKAKQAALELKRKVGSTGICFIVIMCVSGNTPVLKSGHMEQTSP